MRNHLTIASMLVVVGAAALFVGCSGGGQSALSPTSASNAGAPAPQHAMGSALFTLSIPAASGASSARRDPNYISASTQSISIQVTNGNASPGAPTTANLTPGSPNCSNSGAGSPLTCTISVAAPVGTDTFAVTLYSGTNAGGSVLSSATISGTVTAATANSIPITLSGTVASIAVSVTNGNNLIPGGYATTLPVVVTAKDASGATIVGPGNYSNPITLTDADTSGSITTLSTTSVTSPSTVVTLTYNPTDANSGVLDINGLPVGATQIGASATGVSPSNVTPGTFQYIADRFRGYGHARTLNGTGTVVVTTFNAAGSPSPNPSTWSYTITQQDTAHASATFNGATYVDVNHVYTYTQASPATTASPEIQTIDQYQHAVLNPTGAVIDYYGKVVVDQNSGSISSPITGSLVGTVTYTYTWMTSDPFQDDVLPHAAATWSNNFVPVTEAYTGAEVATFTLNADGSYSFIETSPIAVTEAAATSGVATNNNVGGFPGGGSGTEAVGAPIPAPSGTPGDVIPLTAQQTSPSPLPTSTYTVPDWYPGGGAPTSPLLVENYSLGFVTIPAGCNVPSTIATQAWATVLTENYLKIASFQYQQRVLTEYYVPGGIGDICETYTETSTNYHFGTGIRSSQTVINYTDAVTSAGNLSVKRRPQ